MVLLAPALASAALRVAAPLRATVVEEPQSPGAPDLDLPPHYLPPAPPSLEQPAQRSAWYGWQTLTADGLALVVFGFGFATSSYVIGYAGAGVFLFAAPAVHMSHESVHRTFLSFGLRATLPLLGAKVGRDNADCDAGSEDDEQCLLEPGLLGGLVAALVVSAIDAAAISWQRVPQQTSGLSWTPSLSLDQRDARLVVSGRF